MEGLEPGSSLSFQNVSVSTNILNSLHKRGFTSLNCAICSVAYGVKGFGSVEVKYHPEFRAYAARVKGKVYLSTGPGWAYSAGYLRNLLQQTYCFKYLPKVGDTVIDIGAGLGEESTVFAEEVGPAGKVIAIEANPHTFAGLRYVCEENNYEWMKPLNVGIYTEQGTITIEDDPQDYVKNTIHVNGGGNGISIPATTVDKVVMDHGLGHIDYIKCNIEGAERFLVESMKNSILKTRHVCISCHDFRHEVYNQGAFYVTRKLIETFLQDHGFELFARTTGNLAIDGGVYGRNPKLA